jgi:diguanylate cyclase (GGDEF)-like protein
LSTIENHEYESRLKFQLDSLMEAAGDLVLRIDLEGCILQASLRSHQTLGAADLKGARLTEYTSSEDRLALQASVHGALEEDPARRCNARMLTASGRQWFELQISRAGEGDGLHLLVVGRNISGQQQTEERLRYLATHDALTGLPNRALLSDRLKQAMAEAGRSGRGFYVLTIDLDGFKKVNDALGHAVGDQLLCIASERLRHLLREVDTLARVGGDEFVAVLPGLTNEPDLQQVARRMISSMHLPFEIQGHPLYIGASVGAARFPEHGDNEVKLLAHADIAMYRAKELGKSRCEVYSNNRFAHTEHDVSMEAAMYEAVREGEFMLQYQPIVDAASRDIVGFEALMRWMHPGMGTISPSRFIPIAENNGLINLLGAWAMKAACYQVRHFEAAAGRKLYVSVNVSPRQFRDDQFLRSVDDAIKLSGISGEQLLLEITEGTLMSDPEHAQRLMQEIVARGARIAIDDFGTGYSSLAYLKRFPIAALKIDRAFIRDLPSAEKDAAICNVVISLASHLNLITVAEGVEKDEQLEYLTNQGCTLVQGYLTGMPLAPDAAIALLRQPPRNLVSRLEHVQ